ncbi:MAG: response regulator [Planctomycetota bacterium]
MLDGFDISIFVPKFADENKDRIQSLNQSILAFEKNPSNAEVLKVVLREVHTLKGTAKMMGFADIVTLSHKIEDIFVKVRDGGLQPTKKLCDVVFRALDKLADMVEIKRKDAKSHIDIESICGQIEVSLHDGGADGTKAELTQSEVDNVLSAVKQEQIPELTIPAEQEKTVEQEKITPQTVPNEGVKTIRIGLDKVDALYNYLVELIIAQMTFRQRGDDVIKLNHYTKQLKTLKADVHADTSTQGAGDKKSREDITRRHNVEELLIKEIARYTECYETDMVKLDTIIEGIRQQVMFMRMQPISAIFDMAARIVRDLSTQFGKEVELVISGAGVELDNNIIEMLKDPLLHLLRNAIDHGLEEPAVRISAGKRKTGTLSLQAKQEGGDVLIIIEDDGKGIDKELVKESAIRKGLLQPDNAHGLSDEAIYAFIMKPGFSTSKFITDVSGRGVGMDVVKTVIDRLNGNLIIESNKGIGTKFILKLPATIALIKVLIIRVGEMTFALPTSGIEQITHIFWKDVKTLEGRVSVFMTDQTVPVIDLVNAFNLRKEDEQKPETAPVIISRSGGRKIGFIVSEFLHEQEVVFREFKGYLRRPRYFSGVTTLGTGEVILILNMQELVMARDLAGIVSKGESSATAKRDAKKLTILIAEDSLITAELEKNIIENSGYVVDLAVDGMDALDKLYTKKYDLLVTDIDMPIMNGFELTAKVRAGKKSKDIPIIMVTAREKIEDKRRGIEVGADAYILKKEFDQGNLLNTIKRLIGE